MVRTGSDGRALRVLFVHSSSDRYGADRQLELIVTGLERCEPTVVLPERGALGPRLEAAGVEVIVRPLAVIRRELATPRGAAQILGAAARDGAAIARIIRERGVELVHSNTSVVLGGACAAAITRIPHVWHVREIYSRFSHSRFSRAWPLYRPLLESAAALPCVSRATAAQFRSSRVRVIADGLVGDPTRAPRAAARSTLGLAPEVPVIALLGRISDWKGQDVLVRALAEPPLSDVVALIAGDPWPGAEDRLARVVELAASLGVSARVRFLGFREDVANIYGAADLVAVPSSEPDPLPGAAIEAAAAGCTVLASSIGGLPEIIVDGATGRLVEPRDPAALARVARELLDRPREARRLARAAAADVRTRFAPRRLLDSLGALYEELG